MKLHVISDKILEAARLIFLRHIMYRETKIRIIAVLESETVQA